nr:CHASE domain-containing protein [uncultured Cohaesibacter sp.]
MSHRGNVTREEFKTFVSGLEVDETYPGVLGIGFAKLIDRGQEAAAQAEITRDYAGDRVIWPESDQERRTPIMLLEPLNPRNNAAIGFDMFQEPVRRAAMETAMLASEIVATAPVQLVQEMTSEKQAGFLAYAPVYAPATGFEVDNTRQTAPIKGFVYSPIRAGDLFNAVLRQKPTLAIKVKAYDVEANAKPLFVAAGFDDERDDFSSIVTRKTKFAGRTWMLDIGIEKGTAWSLDQILPYFIAVSSVLFAMAVAYVIHAQLQALVSAHRQRALSERKMEDKELLLQEMKHRIKNSIARIMAISRQTLLHSKSLDEFSDSFNARLQAMANAQDALTQSHWQKADLFDLLAMELEQVLGRESFGDQISGPDIELNEEAAPALGLTFHELATNALKYSDVADREDALSVTWNVCESPNSRELQIRWVEMSKATVKAPTHKGFGTKLIDANILGVLSGTINRQYSENGLVIDISIPLPPQRSKEGKSSKRS